MHVIVLRRELHERHPWLAGSLQKAFTQSRDLAYAALQDVGALTTSLPWQQAEVVRTRELLGDDWWSYGLEANRHVLDTFLRYHHDQGLSHRRVTPDELFAPSALEAFAIWGRGGISGDMSGLDTTALARLRTAIEGDIELGRYDGAVVLVARDGEVGMLEAIGSSDRDAGRPARTDDVFRVLSVTKALTNVLVLRGDRARSLRADLQGRRRHPGVPRIRPLPRTRQGRA